jgi:FRG domain
MRDRVVELLSAGSKEELGCLLRERPPELGRVRMYRGQTKRYRKKGQDALLPALHRERRGRYDPTWMMAAQDAVFRNRKRGSNELSHVWLPALLQHYGPGSFFLDVTAELNVALWFAMHRFYSDSAEMRLQFWGEPATVSIPFAYYEPLTLPFRGEFSPVIYVFDALTWTGFGRPAHSDLVAVKSLPVGQQLLYRATRLDRQSACLLYADPEAFFGPDLAFALRAIVILAEEFEWGDAPIWTTTDLFPFPSKDPCYASLWAIPLEPNVSMHEFNHPLNILWYVSGPEVANVNAQVQVNTMGDHTIERDDLISRLHAARRERGHDATEAS